MRCASAASITAAPWKRAHCVVRRSQRRANIVGVPARSRSGKTLTAKEKAVRDADLCIDHALGLSYPKLAAKYGLSESGARKIYDLWMQSEIERDAVEDKDAVMRAYEYRARFEAIEQRLAEIAVENADNDNARVGALRTLLTATNQRIALDQAMGKLPRQLGKLRIDLDVRHVSAVLVKVLKDYDFPEDGLREIQRVLKGVEPKTTQPELN